MILTVAIPTPLRRLFDYLPLQLPDSRSEIPAPGVRVRVSFGNRNLVGLVVGASESSDLPADKLKPVIEVIDHQPLISPQLLALFMWAASYYQHPVGDALFTTIPALLRKGAPVPALDEEHWALTAKGLGLGQSSLKRAKKQRELVDVLNRHGSLPAATAMERGFNRQIFNQLVSKELAHAIRVDHPARTVNPLLAEAPLSLREEQRLALASIKLDQYSTTVLFGDTGTGKTEVYLQAIEQVLARGGQALVLVPEINLTPQTLTRFQRRFNCSIQAIHSGMTDRERLQSWAQARSGRARIIIGTRSAVFTPMPDLGIIILDEEHDPSFKQQEGFRYSARDVAVMRGNKAGVPVILGSATPSLESLHNCSQGRYQLQQLRQRNQSSTPRWRLVDLKGTHLQGGFAAATIEAIRDQLSRGHQVLVFLNRRGYAPVMLCHDCGWQACCRHCSTKMTVHLGRRQLICHHCENPSGLPSSCPDCGSSHLMFSGQGTERGEETLNELFPETPVIRIDRDSTRRKGVMARAIERIKEGSPCILLGTQMLAKGHHFPAVSLAVLLDVDGGLFSTDFRATERTAQMIVQVGGRAGRGNEPGQVYLQSHFCDHPIIADLVNGDYRHFTRKLLDERRALSLPPFTHFAYFRCDARQPRQSERFLQLLREQAERVLPPSTTVNYLGPLPGAIEKRRDLYRYTLLINAVNRTRLTRELTRLSRWLDQQKLAPGLRWSLDVDPVDVT